MKRKFSKILGVGLTLALLASLLLTAAPVSALTQPSVSLDDYEISADAVYTITFQVVKALAVGDQIVVTFPTGTDITGITTGADADVTIGASSGIGVPASAATDAGSGTVEQVLTITVPDMDPEEGEYGIGAGATVQLVIGTDVAEPPVTAHIVNPDDIGDYTLTVATQTDVPVVKEAAVTSTAYSITAPVIPVLPGIVQQFNAAGILMAQDTGDSAISDMLETAKAGYTIVVGPGEYLDPTIDIVSALEGLTLKSSAGAEDTTIVGTISISAAEVIVDGFTVEHSGSGISIGAADVTVQNNILTAESCVMGIVVSTSATGATISGNELDINSTMYVQGSGHTLSDNAFGAGINLHTTSEITITGNTIIDAEGDSINFIEGGTYYDILIEDNIISGTTGTGVAAIYVRGNVTKLQILDNDITDNECDGIIIDAEATWEDGNVIKFNTITGNEDYGINSAVNVDATFNWWGTDVAADIAAMIAGTGIVTYAPFLVDTAEAVFSASAVVAGITETPVTSLDAKTAVGVKVSVANATAVDTIVLVKYIANPEEDIADAIAFFDVYVAGVTPDVEADEPTATIKFYAGDANTEVYVWSADTDMWVGPLDADFSVYGGYVYITVDAALLAGTPFALVGVVPEAEEIGAPKILAPVTGDDTVSLTPVFAWGAVTDAEGYYFELADNVNFVTPIIQLDGEMGRLFVTAYAYVGELEYSTAYYWRVKAVSGAFNPWIQWTQDAHFDVESDWASGVFITMDEPEEELPPVVVEEAPPVIIEPIVEVITPAATEVTPGWIYVIIAVGGVLVIALLVLIVRTRRVA